jgi:hypothetical protein
MKNTAIRASFIQCSTERPAALYFRNTSYPSLSGELATMIAAAEAMMSTMPPAAGELKNADGTSDILFLFLSGISDTLPPFIQKNRPSPDIQPLVIRG